VKRSLSDWANLAEILGAMAIVISLVFVGLQISDGNRATRAATAQAASDQTMVLHGELLRYAGTWQKVLDGSELAPGEEHRRGILLFGMVMTENENRALQFDSGYLGNRRTNLGLFVTLPMYEQWRASPGASGHSADFLRYLDGLKVSTAR
jgi:hypothetical protein